MSYLVEYINCLVCASDRPQFLGLRGNLEYKGAPALAENQAHIVTNVVRCRNCGFVYTNPKITLPMDKKTDYYSNPSEYSAASGGSCLEMFNETLDRIQVFTKGKGKLLDVGAGKGEFLAQAAQRGWQVWGVEPSEEFARYARDKYSLSIQNSHLEEADLPQDFFDVVTLNMVLEHSENPHSLLSAVCRVLKKGGILYIELPNINSALLKLGNIYYKIKGRNWSTLLSPLHPPYHCYGYPVTTLKLLTQRHGIEVKKSYILGIGKRGFREHSKDKFWQWTRNILAKVFAWFRQGDILVAVAIKQ